LLQSGESYYSSDLFSSHAPAEPYFKYANLNFGVIVTLSEALSGERFDRYVKSTILELLGMLGSFNVADLADVDNVAALYRQESGSRRPQLVDYNGANGNNYYDLFNHYALGNHETTKLIPEEPLIGHPGEAYGLISDLNFSKDRDFGSIFLTLGLHWDCRYRF